MGGGCGGGGAAVAGGDDCACGLRADYRAAGDEGEGDLATEDVVRVAVGVVSVGAATLFVSLLGEGRRMGGGGPEGAPAGRATAHVGGGIVITRPCAGGHWGRFPVLRSVLLFFGGGRGRGV